MKSALRRPGALVHLAWWITHDRRRLVFGWVEILPPGLPPQAGHPFKPYTPAGRSRARFYVARFPMEAKAAELWFESASEGSVLLPGFPDAPSAGDGQALEDPPRRREPSFGEVAAMHLPFAPLTGGAMRVAGLFDDPGPELRAALADPGTRAWLSQHLFFDLAAHPEFLGALVRVRPNPVLRRVDRRLSPRVDGDDELVNLTPWPGASLEGCEFLAVEQRPLGFGAPVRVPVTDPLIRLSWPGRTDRTGIAVVHPEHGLCAWQEPLPFLRTIALDLSAPVQKRRVEVREQDGTVVADFEAPRIDQLGSTSRIGDGANDGPFDVVAAHFGAERRRQKAQLSSELGVRWFANPKQAADTIRDMLRYARERVWIIDPYFGGTELLAFGLAVPGGLPDVAIVTSAEYLRRRIDDRGPSENGERLADIVGQVAARGFPGLKVRVMEGAVASVHDRFIVCDGRVWLSGNSLHALGKRSSVLIELPDGEEAMARLRPTLDEALPLDTWMEKRRRTRAQT